MPKPATILYVDATGAEVKKCTKCNEVKSVEEFRIRGHNIDSRETQCKTCCCNRAKLWYHKNLEKRRAYDRKRSITHRDILKRRRIYADYKLSEKAYERIRKEQNYLCRICFTHESMCPNGTLCVDHCHETNKVRGLLCSRCNIGIGQFKDSIERMTAAIAYLKSHGKT